MFTLSLLSLLLAPAALAIPWRRGGFQGACSVPQSAFKLPSNFDALTSPPNLALVGFGVQNYTCNTNGTFDSVGAVAQLMDISCLFGTPEFAKIQTDTFSAWNSCPGTDPLTDTGMLQLLQSQFNITAAGQHYFVKQAGTLEPVWDLRSSGPFVGNPGAIVFAHKVQTAPSPDGPSNVALLELKKDSGELANTVYRLNTVSGQPPSSCSPNASTSVKYAANYLLL